MDTSTHITMGFGLAGLAYIDPAVAANPELAHAILIGTVAGSNAPDFDYVIKLFKGNGMYTEHHRGASHSIPALFILTLIISSVISLFFSHITFLPLLYWTFLAVILHVGFDIMNTYGTQAGRPFTKKWLSLNFIPLFDPIIILIHVIGFILWLTNFSPGIVFFYGYFILTVYLIIRFFVSLEKRRYITEATNKMGEMTIIPTMWLQKWDFVHETESTYQVGSIHGKNINWIHQFDKADFSCEIINVSLADKNVQHFLANSKHTHVLYFPTPSGFDVQWIDLRFRNKDYYPYMAIVKLDRSQNIIASYTGWVHNTKRLDEKLLSTQNRAIQL
ncbi:MULTISPECIES: metal-dependent hydrolase [Metabacillus]|jgi:inner membrane protein|uniref:Metal-dependent hydrolase n=1 Tax=Metabacillus rhizolycopersici TaxID=2875709 RepID=A0ABS7UMB8_9BACI|nr:MULTISPECIES: metal-dependent hydrolase [Metabacillus]MBZ5749192.1 metal-dependent hydrolase [Metabacillus rhizolycopersici]MCM3652037.1 metal-dependent hydrolase [Metabacillus litoralis]